jgi:hypothetical protein
MLFRFRRDPHFLTRENAQACLNSPEWSGKVARARIFNFVALTYGVTD